MLFISQCYGRRIWGRLEEEGGALGNVRGVCSSIFVIFLTEEIILKISFNCSLFVIYLDIIVIGSSKNERVVLE